MSQTLNSTPAGIANGSHWAGLTKMALPLIRYRVWQSDGSLRRLLDPLFTTWDADWAGYTIDAVRDMPFDFRIPPLGTDQELGRRPIYPICVGVSPIWARTDATLQTVICKRTAMASVFSLASHTKLGTIASVD